MKIKGVLFDMDGVLVDSEEFICQAAIRMFREHGVEVQPEDFEPFVGTGEDRYISGVAEKYGVEIDIQRDKKRTYEIYGELAKNNLEALPGAKEFIHRCAGKGLKLAVATSADKVKMEINLKETGLDHDTFDALLKGEDVENKKPSPEIYLTAANRLQLKPEECLVVEDAVSGVKAAKSAGCKCLAVTTSFQEDKLAEADWIVDSLKNVPEDTINW
ncbi:MAG TPA: HAD-IA family hydrolase [Bacteroidales bacterium]|nr:HAD-IA family hydrolase [Bacteroidales bacterium]